MDQGQLRTWLRWCTGAYAVKSVSIFASSHSGFPTAHTCFNSVDMPSYPTEDVLRERMLMAMDETAMGVD
jgi:hypothetical protein